VATEVKPGASDFAGAAYLGLIEQQLEAEQRRKDSLEQRGLALVTISGFLAGVLFALVTWATSEGRPPVERSVKALLVASVASFFVGALCGLIAIRTQKYEEPKVDDLASLLTEDYWGQRAADGTLSVAEVLVAVLRDARDKNGKKALWVEAGVWFEAVAALILLASVIILLV